MEKNQIIFGRNPIIEAIKGPTVLEKIYIDRELKGDFEKEIRSLTKKHSIPVSKIPNRQLSKWTRGNHQGIIGIAALVKYGTIDHLLYRVENHDVKQILILDHITDVRNMGAIFRSAFFFGISHILLPMKGTAEINEDAMKSSAGALNHVRLFRTSNLMEGVQKLKDAGFSVMSLESKGGKPMSEIEAPEKLALVIGSEGHGVTVEMLKLSDARVLIPSNSDFDSLNVSVASGIAFYELSKKK